MFKIQERGGEHYVVNEDGQQVGRHDDRGKALRQMAVLYERAGAGSIECLDESCHRGFLDFATMVDHAETVHTFDDIRTLVADKVRETYGRRGEYDRTPVIPGIWVWVADLSTDWVVFSVESDGDTKLMKADYTILENEVTLGSAVEVVRKTVYEPAKKGDE